MTHVEHDVRGPGGTCTQCVPDDPGMRERAKRLHESVHPNAPLCDTCIHLLVEALAAERKLALDQREIVIRNLDAEVAGQHSIAVENGKLVLELAEERDRLRGLLMRVAIREHSSCPGCGSSWRGETHGDSAEGFFIHGADCPWPEIDSALSEGKDRS